MTDYVHGYSDTEAGRLHDQANTLGELLHNDSIFPPGAKILEAGCGTGCQTVFLALKNPSCHITSVDISRKSIDIANERIKKQNISNVHFQTADIFNLSFEDESFDHVFLCFVLEHLPEPVTALTALKRVLKKGGSITIIEGDHGSTYFYPDSAIARKTVQCLVDIQADMKGNALVGRELFPILSAAGFTDCAVSPRMVYVDASKPELVDGFTKKTFIAMIEGVKDEAIKRKLMIPSDWDAGINDLYRTTEKDGVFCYTFFKAKALKKI